jgi:hypothetical protein
LTICKEKQRDRDTYRKEGETNMEEIVRNLERKERQRTIERLDRRKTQKVKRKIKK